MKREGDRLIPKVKVEMTDDDRRRMQVKDNALHMLFFALEPDMYSKMSSYTSAKNVWDTLETTYEGINDVKETKIGLLNLSYKNFKMEPDENVLERSLPKTSLSRSYSTLPELWDSKRTAIIEAKDLKILKLDAPLISLLTHEIMKQDREEEKKREEKKLEKKEVEKKNIGIALKALQEESDSTQIASWSDEDSSDEKEQEVANLCLMALEEDSKVYDELFENNGALEDNLKKTTKDAPLPAYTWTFEPAVIACGRTPLVAKMLQHTGVQNRQSAEKTKQPRYFAAHMALLQELSPT
ncbi:hypothetical protein GQ457_05G023480 [Hibiscus cannabinus]